MEELTHMLADAAALEHGWCPVHLAGMALHPERRLASLQLSALGQMAGSPAHYVDLGYCQSTSKVQA